MLSVHGLKMEVDPLAFEITLAASVKAGGANKVFVPDLMAIPLAEATEGSLRDRIGKVQNAKARAWAAVGPLIIEMVKLEAQLDEAARTGDQELFDKLSAQVSNMRRDLQPVSDPLSRPISGLRAAESVEQDSRTFQPISIGAAAARRGDTRNEPFVPGWAGRFKWRPPSHQSTPTSYALSRRRVELRRGRNSQVGAVKQRWVCGKGGVFTARHNATFQVQNYDLK